MLLLAVACTFVAAGCISGIQATPPGSVAGRQFYDLGNLTGWKYAVNMSASGVDSSWNMTVNNTRGEGGERHMIVGTIGNGMDIVYDIWWNATTYQVSRMHARGWVGDDYQDRDVSTLQIYTLPDTGLTYYFVPFQHAGNVTVKGGNGAESLAYVYTAADNKGFRVTYWAHPMVPLPIKVEMSSADFKITMTLVDYR
jgi:hypothetical protein